MKSRKIRVGTVVFSFVLLFVTLFSPSIFALEKDDKSASSDRYMQLFQYVYTFLQKNYVDEVDPKVLYEGAMKGMLESLKDPYTTYIDSKSLLGMSLKDTTTGSFGGVGLSITKPIENTPDKPAYVEVASPIEDTPGWKAGVQPGDLILDIDGTATADITMEDVLAKLRGPVGTNVTVKIRRGKLMEFPVTMKRALIEVPTVKYTMMDGGIGYLRIIEFTPVTAERVAEALKSFSKAGYTSLIIDIRNNPGGLITSVVDVADQFIDSGVIVSTRSRIAYENRAFKATSGKSDFDPKIPVVVLLNRGSASAAEILSGALKDYHLAYLVGETSYGKGSVQQVMDLLSQDAMKVTMARYYTPSDANIDKQGIPPDREILFPKELVKAYPADLRVMKKLVEQEYYRTHISPLYDLDYDIQLKSAVDILKKEDVFALLKTTKTVKELQDAAAATVASKDKTGADAAGADTSKPDSVLVPDPVQ
jgi:carboxyl-terminal processing protease